MNSATVVSLVLGAKEVVCQYGKRFRSASVSAWVAGILVLCLSPSSGQAGITVDGHKAWTYGFAVGANVYNAAGSDKLVVAVAGESGFPGNYSCDVMNITYNGQALTKIVEEAPVKGASQTTADIWYLDNPGLYAGPGTIVLSLNGNNWCATAIGLSGTAPGFGATVHVSCAASVGLTTTAADSMVLAVFGSGGNGNTALLKDGNPPLTTIEKHKISRYAGITTAYTLSLKPGVHTFSFAATETDVVTLAAEFLPASPGASNAITVNTPHTPAAGAVIYEPFMTRNTPLNGSSAGRGLLGTWTAKDKDMLVTVNSLRYGTLQTAGGHAANIRRGQAGGAFVKVGPELKDAGLLADGATLWFSFLALGGEWSNAGLQVAFALGTGPLIGSDNYPLGNKGEAIGVVLNAMEHVLPACWIEGGLTCMDGKTKMISEKTPVFVVGRINWGAESHAPDIISIYLPGEDLALPGAPLAVNSAILNQKVFDTLSFTGKGQITPKMDEIRFGRSYADVIGQTQGTSDGKRSSASK